MPTPTTFPPPELLLNAMTLEQKIGQVMLIGFDGTSVDADLRLMITDYHVGGVILFARNIESPEQVARLTNELQTIAIESGHPGLFIAIDQEGGRVARLTEAAGFTEFPGAMALAATGDPENAYRAAVAMAAELRAVGINIDFAPDLDVNNNPANPVIGIRSFSSDPQRVAQYGLAFARGLQENGVLAFGKHFPGHGDTGTDSHIALPLVPHDRTRLDQVELVPFRAAIQAGFAGIMSAHVTFPAIDPTPGLAATLSRPVLTGLLREELGFNGLIVTDSLEMGALMESGYPPEVGGPLALAAGADLLLFNHGQPVQVQAHANMVRAVKDGKISLEQLNASVLRILHAKERYGILMPSLVDESAAAGSVKTPEHISLSRELAQKAITLLRDPNTLIPLSGTGPVLIAETPAVRDQTSNLIPGSTILGVDVQPSQDQITTVLHAARDDRVVIVLVNDLNVNTAQATLVQALVDAGNPVIVIAHRNPFDAMLLPDSVTVLATYGFNPPMVEALTNVLAGKAKPAGILTVDIP